MTTYTAEPYASQLARVRDKVKSTVIRFARSRLGKTYNASDLLRYCRVLQPEIAPDSPSRIMRDLRRAGVIDYTLISRQNSQYRVDYVVPASVARA